MVIANSIGTARAVATVVTQSHLGGALALFGQSRARAFEYDQYICLIDEQLPSSIPQHIQLLRPSDIGFASLQRFLFQYNPLELACALKPYVLRYLHSHGYTQTIYLDSDIYIPSSLHTTFETLTNASIVLTPHLKHDLPDSNKLPDERSFLRAGAYNAGFVAVAGTSSGRHFLDWWCEKTRHDCIDMVEDHLYVDQKWLDLVPGMYDGVRIVRNAGVNLSYWDLAGRQLSRSESGAWQVDGEPLEFFHFSGFDPRHPKQLSRYQNRLSVDEIPGLAELIDDYVRHLAGFDTGKYATLGYEYASLDTGEPIKPLWREAIRVGHDLLEDIEDPFSTTRYPGLRAKFAAIDRASTTDPSLGRFQNPVVEKIRLSAIKKNFVFAPLLSICRRFGFIKWD